MTRRHTAPREIKMASVSDMAGATQFLDRADVTEKVQALFDEDLAELGFVMNASRLWAYEPEALAMLFSLMSQVASARPSRFRERVSRGRVRLGNGDPDRSRPGEPSSRRGPMRSLRPEYCVATTVR